MYDSFIHICFFLCWFGFCGSTDILSNVWVLLFTITLGLLVHLSLGLTVLLEVKNGSLEDELSLRNKHLLTSIKWSQVRSLSLVCWILPVMKFWLYIESLERSTCFSFEAFKITLGRQCILGFSTHPSVCVWQVFGYSMVHRGTNYSRVKLHRWIPWLAAIKPRSPKPVVEKTGDPNFCGISYPSIYVYIHKYAPNVTTLYKWLFLHVHFLIWIHLILYGMPYDGINGAKCWSLWLKTCFQAPPSVLFADDDCDGDTMACGTALLQSSMHGRPKGSSVSWP